MRDMKGRFVHGHKQLADRDPSSGKFVSKTVDAQDKYSKVRKEVDNFLEALEGD